MLTYERLAFLSLHGHSFAIARSLWPGANPVHTQCTLSRLIFLAQPQALP